MTLQTTNDSWEGLIHESFQTYISFSMKHMMLGWLRLYSDMSKVGNVNLPGREIDKHDEISG